MKYEYKYKSNKGISFLKNKEQENGYCYNCGHYNIIPACTLMIAGNKLLCTECNSLIWKCVPIEIYEKEIIINECT